MMGPLLFLLFLRQANQLVFHRFSHLDYLRARQRLHHLVCHRDLQLVNRPAFLRIDRRISRQVSRQVNRLFVLLVARLLCLVLDQLRSQLARQPCVLLENRRVSLQPPLPVDRRDDHPMFQRLVRLRHQPVLRLVVPRTVLLATLRNVRNYRSIFVHPLFL